MPIKSRNRLAALLPIALLTGLALLQAPAWAAEPAAQVRVTTSMGDFVIEVRSDRAPATAANFLRYVREGFYNGTLFHRVVANFVIQGGGYEATTGKLKTTHENVVNESGNGLQNKRGAVGLARGEQAHSGNAQFFVNIADNPDLDPVPTRWGYAVFGRVIQGMDVIDRIGEIPTGSVGEFKADSPLKQVVIIKAEVLGAAAAAAAAPQAATPVVPTHPDNILSPK
jgi:cyclophilin family peptidyl-prolyl cis-trans isomerase